MCLILDLRFYITCIVLFGVHYTQQQQQQQQDTSTLQILGLFTFTNCQSEHEFDCRNALLNEQRMLAFHQKHNNAAGIICIKDVADSTQILVDAILPIIEGDPNRQINCRGNGVYDNKIKRLIVMTHVSFHLTRLASSMLLLPEFNSVGLLISITDRPMYPAYFFEHPSAVYSFEAGFGVEVHENMIKLKNQFNVTYFGILNIENVNQMQQTAHPAVSTVDYCQEDPKRSAMCYYATENPDNCIKELYVDVNNLTMIKESTRRLSQNNITFVLLSGDSQSLQRYTEYANIDVEAMKEIIYIAYITKIKSYIILDDLSYRERTVLVDFPGASAINRLMYHILDFQKSLLLGERFYWDFLLTSKQFQDFLRGVINCDSLKIFDKDYVCGSLITFETIAKIPFHIRSLFVSRIASDKRVSDALIKAWKKAHYIEFINYQNLLRQQIYNPSYALQAKPYCELKKPTCDKGYELVHSFYKERDWTRSFGWNCQACPANFFKRVKGSSEKCVECLHPKITNINHTRCYDPYLLFNLSVTDLWSVVFLIAPSAIMLFLVGATMIVFYIKKKTPIVQSSNRRMTDVQLVAHALLFVIPNVIFFARVSSSICIARQVVLGFAFSITISINISKSQTLFMIVNKKVQMSRSEILLAKTSEWIIILGVLCVDALLHALAFTNKSVAIETKYHDAILIKEHYCSNGTMVYIQLLFASFLSACNGIQGFRARHLPSQFRETNHVIYSSFISLVVSISATGMYFSQTEEWRKELITLAVTLILNTVHFVLLYGYKMFIIIFRPQLNTNQVFAQKRLAKIAR